MRIPLAKEWKGGNGGDHNSEMTRTGRRVKGIIQEVEGQERTDKSLRKLCEGETRAKEEKRGVREQAKATLGPPMGQGYMSFPSRLTTVQRQHKLPSDKGRKSSVRGACVFEVKGVEEVGCQGCCFRIWCQNPTWPMGELDLRRDWALNGMAEASWTH